MPNEKVRFLKHYELIKDKIVYVKDKDILGFDSSNSLAFQFRYWKLKEFGISENFIAMDDDCFIGSPLKKTDFFYISNGSVIPIIVASKFLEINKNNAKKKLLKFKKIIKKNNEEQTSASFKYSLYLTYLFILQKFNNQKYFPIHTHNAIPVNLKELKEIYDIVYQSEYKSSTLDSLYRKNDNLQFQVMVLSYTFIKYEKKVKSISNKLIQNNYALFEYYNYSLFCINTGAIKYSPLSFMKSKIIMEYLFPNPTPYEISNDDLHNLSFNIIYLIEKDFIQYKINQKYYVEKLKNELNLYIKKKKFISIFIIIIFIFYLFIIIIVKINMKNNS